MSSCETGNSKRLVCKTSRVHLKKSISALIVRMITSSSRRSRTRNHHFEHVSSRQHGAMQTQTDCKEPTLGCWISWARQRQTDGGGKSKTSHVIKIAAGQSEYRSGGISSTLAQRKQPKINSELLRR
jgi:hypothetical protein